MQEQQNYGGYTGNPQYDGPPQQQQYSMPPQGQSVPPPIYDDTFMDSFAQRLSQRMAQGPQGKIYPQGSRKDRASAGQRLALAIVSVVMLVPLGGIAAGLVGASGVWFVGLAAFSIAALTILLINVVFNLNG
ncbi:MAG: hypothetical protein NVSMB38_26600 [Ktedonobacteraceae bacterium]